MTIVFFVFFINNNRHSGWKVFVSNKKENKAQVYNYKQSYMIDINQHQSMSINRLLPVPTKKKQT